MRSRDLNLEKYGISTYLYRELHAFCQQYNEKKAKVNSLYGPKSNSFFEISKGNYISDPTARAAELCEKYKEDIDLIEKTAKEVDKKLAPFIIKSVTEDVPPWALQTRYGMEVGEKTFNKKRRDFYFVLAKLKNCI